MNKDPTSTPSEEAIQTCEFWQGLAYLVDSHCLVIDRPRGSSHPHWPGFLYPLDYGYLEGTASGDGDGVDVWLGSLKERKLVGLLVTLDLVKRDVEVKLLVGCSAQEMQTAFTASISPGMQALLIQKGSR